MQPNTYRDIRKSLLVVMILVPLVPFLASMGIGYTSYRASMKQGTLDMAERIASDHAALIASFLNERRTDLDLILNTMGGAELTQPGRLQSTLKSLQQVSSAFIDLGLIDDQGVQQAYAGRYDLAGKQYSEAAWYKEACTAGSYVSDVYLGYRHKPHFVVAVTARTLGKTWMLRATVDQAFFGDLVKRVSIGSTGEAYIINKAGVLQTEMRSGGALLELHPGPNLFAPGSDNGADVAGDFVYATAPLNNGKWQMVVRQASDEALQKLDWAAMSIAIVGLVGGGFIVGLAFMVSGKTVDMLRSKEQDRREMEVHLMRAAKLAELGEMSAGFAHEINNPLQIMTSEIALLEIVAEESGKDQPISVKSKMEVLDGLAQLKKQIHRCAGITRSILKLGRRTDPELKVLKLDKFLPEVCEMIRRRTSVAGIELTCLVAENTQTIQADAGQLQQVMLNLMNNAIQAIEDRHGSEGGRLNIHAQDKDNKSINILVQDNGNGISPENMERIFNPFFTTKAPNKGTGLGLSVCHAIIEAMGGTIDAKSKPGNGTTFCITLPAYQAK